MLHCFDLVPANRADLICRRVGLKGTKNIWRLKAALKVYYIKLFISNSQKILFEKVVLKTLYASLFVYLQRKYIEAFLFIFEIFFELFDVDSNKTAVFSSNDQNSLLVFWMFFPRHYIDSKV